MTVIVLSQDVASHGDHVAAAIAEKFNLEIVRQEELAQRVAAEVPDESCRAHRIMDGKASVLECCRFAGRRLLRRLAREIAAVAARDNVLLEAFGAAALLRPVSHVVHLGIGTSRAAAVAELRPAAPCGSALRLHIERWMLGLGRRSANCDLVLEGKDKPIGECLEQVDRLLRNPRYWTTAPSQAVLLEMRSLLALDLRGDAELGFQRVPLRGANSDEEAIAQIEAWLHQGTAPDRVDFRYRLPQAPDGIL
jgi:hypothetical protein